MTIPPESLPQPDKPEPFSPDAASVPAEDSLPHLPLTDAIEARRRELSDRLMAGGLSEEDLKAIHQEVRALEGWTFPASPPTPASSIETKTESSSTPWKSFEDVLTKLLREGNDPIFIRALKIAGGNEVKGVKIYEAMVRMNNMLATNMHQLDSDSFTNLAAKLAEMTHAEIEEILKGGESDNPQE